MNIRLQVGNLFGIFPAHKYVWIYIFCVHIRCIQFFNPVQTILCIIRAGYIYTIVFIQNCQRACYILCFTYFYRRRIAQRRMLKHIFSIFIFTEYENIKFIILAVSTPVILRRLERVIHLIDPCAYQRRIFSNRSDNAAAPVISACKRTVRRRDISCIRRKRRQRHPVRYIINVSDIPGKAYTVAAGFSFRYICRPFLCKSFRINQSFLIQFMQPCNPVFKSLLCGGADYLQIICNRNMPAAVSIAVALAKAVYKNRRVLAAIQNTRHRDNASVNVKLCLKL